MTAEHQAVERQGQKQDSDEPPLEGPPGSIAEPEGFGPLQIVAPQVGPGDFEHLPPVALHDHAQTVAERIDKQTQDLEPGCLQAGFLKLFPAP